MARPPDTYPEDVREAFEYCDECETIVVSVKQHTCPTRERANKKLAPDRAALAAEDDRPMDEDVLYPLGRSQNGAWAYHELGPGGEPLHEIEYNGGSDIGPRSEAIRKGCYPCGQCLKIAERRDDG